MLNLLGSVVTQARHLQEIGRTHDALSLLRRYAIQPELPASVAGEAHHLMGELCLNLQQHRQARKHLTAALRLRPDDAAAHHMMANAIDRDPQVDAQAASRFYHRALDLAPNDVALLADAGLFHVDMGRSEKGLNLLRRAIEIDPDDLDVLQSLLVALGELDRFDEARRELNRARFRHGRDPRYLKLVSDLEFHESRRRQRNRKSADELQKPAGGVLPFLRIVSDDEPKKPAKRFSRLDQTSASRPHLARSARRPKSNRV
jgi:Flp pilus assembly protein TadD